MRYSFNVRSASLRTKLLLAFTGMVLMLAAAGGAGLFSVKTISGQVGIFAEVTAPLEKHAAVLSGGFKEMHIIIMDTMTMDTEQEIAGEQGKMETVSREIDGVLSQLPGLVNKAGIAYDFGRITGLKGQLQPLVQAFFVASRNKVGEEKLAGERLADFEKERAALDQILVDFTSQSETAMNTKEDSSKTLAQSGNATVEDLSKALDEVFAEDYPLVKGASALQRYLVQMQDIARSFLTEKEEARLTAMNAEFDKVSGKATSRVVRLAGRAVSPEVLEKLSGGFKKLQEKVTGPAGLFAQHRASRQADSEMARNELEIEALLGQMMAELDALTKKVAQVNKDTTRKVEAGVQTSRYQLTLLVIAGVVIGFVIALLITRSIALPIHRIVQELDHDAERVAGAAEQVSLAGHTLAKGASEQAASLEEVSASLEEMASMTQQNADNARQGSSLMSDVNRVVQQANTSMQELTASMNAISRASEETSKIVKTIEEIAFQTNLLALNAAVEAARAGEAGAGFAVVADEVRNLALRASDAAKNTALLIEDTIVKVKGGGSVVSKSADDFARIMESTTKLGELINEIAGASDDQAKGVGQINQAINAMDRVVQASAANAEESAALADEMKSAASEMKGVVGTLEDLVRGGGNTEASPGEKKQLLLAENPSSDQ